MNSFVKKNILGVGMSVVSEREVLEYIVKNLDRKTFIVTPNPEIIVFANNNSEYKKVLNRANLALPDGVGVMWAAKLLGISLRQKISGVDLVESLCREASKRPITVGFLGGRDQIADRAAECLKKRFSGLKVGFAGPEIRKFSDLKGTDILFVAFGSPKQEFWIAENLKRLPVKAAIGVGGAFDMIAGRVPRAPVWLQNLGFEWLFRLIVQPWRIKRQLSLLIFAFLVLKEKFWNN